MEFSKPSLYGSCRLVAIASTVAPQLGNRWHVFRGHFSVGYHSAGLIGDDTRNGAGNGLSGGLIGNEQSEGHTTDEDNLVEKRSEFFGGFFKETQVWIRHSTSCAAAQQRVHVPGFFHCESHRIRREVRRTWNRAARLSVHFYKGARTISREPSLPDRARPAVVHRRPGNAISGARPQLRSVGRGRELLSWEERHVSFRRQESQGKRNG